MRFVLDKGQSLHERIAIGWTRRCTPQPLATHQQPLDLTSAIDRIENVTCYSRDGYSPSLFPPFYEKAKGWKTIKITCGHDVMLEMPEELAAALAAAP